MVLISSMRGEMVNVEKSLEQQQWHFMKDARDAFVKYSRLLSECLESFENTQYVEKSLRQAN